MTKHFFSVLIFIFIIFFVYFISSTYVSNSNREKISSNRSSILSNVKKNLLDLPLLKNDTNDVIEFNSGYNDHNNKIKRNFWNLFKKDD